MYPVMTVETIVGAAQVIAASIAFVAACFTCMFASR